MARFNPRARKERDAKTIIDGIDGQLVSIHAPVKSATLGDNKHTD